MSTISYSHGYIPMAAWATAVAIRQRGTRQTARAVPEQGKRACEPPAPAVPMTPVRSL
jgi:hypothetical protein